MLPFLIGGIVFLALAFFTFSFFEIKRIENSVEKRPVVNFENVYEKYEKSADKQNVTLSESYLKWKSLTYIEKFAIENRYHQANPMVMTQDTSIYFGFLTGMVLCFVGATFILGKFSEKTTQVSADTSLWNVSLTSSSPGIILSVIGVLLIITTILSKSEITVKDTSLYMPVSIENFKSNDFPDFPNVDSAKIDEDAEIARLRRKK